MYWEWTINSLADWLERYGDALQRSWPQLAVTALAALALAALGAWLSRRPSRLEGLARFTRRRTVVAGLFLLAATLLLVRAWQMLWVGDDAYISFRYVDNLVAGHGLVFNIGERVEGYTNFLWVILLAPFAALGLPSPEVSLVLNLVFAALHVLVMVLLLREHDPWARSGKPFLPIAPFLIGFNYAFLSYCTSGMETALGACLVTTGLYFALKPVGFRNGLLAGSMLILGTMTRPDYSLFYVAMAAAVAYDVCRAAPAGMRSKLSAFLSPALRRAMLGYALPFVVLYLPYFFWRWNYYGYPYPNTYYAKMAYDSYWSQGFVYLVTFLFGDNFWIAGLWWIGALWLSRKTTALRRLNVFAVTASVLVTFYTVKIGGDFMYGRFFAPLAPLLLLSLETGLKAAAIDGARTRPEVLRSTSKRAFLAIGLSVFLAGWLALPFRLIPPWEIVRHVADESSYYRVNRFHPLAIRSTYFDLSQALMKAFADFEEKPLLASTSIGMIAYYSKTPIIDIFGLTDEHVAHQPYKGRRQRPGHERRADLEYIKKRNPYIFRAKFNDYFHIGYDALTSIYFNDIVVITTAYRPDILERLSKNKRVQFRYTDFPRHLDRYIRQMPHKPTAEIEKDLYFFEDFYFKHNLDPKRLQAIQSHLSERHAELLTGTSSPRKTTSEN
ncbi:MAG: hypothetical protein C4523_18495 [Myxococcales bacterium]|nr:MAG: hypothetical protein C4523_18495 [Myxococcales bacterium]